MYEEKSKKGNIDWRNLILKMLLLLILVFIIIWIVSLVNKNNGGNESNISTNLQSMKTAALDYFQGSKLPENINGKRKITLGEMYDSKLLVEFKDQNGKACDTTNSYAEATKVQDGYSIKVKLVCSKDSTYDIITIANKGNVDNKEVINNNVEVKEETKTNTSASNTSKNTSSNTTKTTTTNNTSKTTTTNNTSKTTTTTNTVAKNTCTYGNKEYSSSYPLAYVIPGDCAVGKADYYKAEYANKINTISVAEYQKLINEIDTLKRSTGANLTVLTPSYSGVYNKANTGLVGYLVKYTVKNGNNVVYEYYLSENGNRTVITDTRNSIKQEETHTYCAVKTERAYSNGYVDSTTIANKYSHNINYNVTLPYNGYVTNVYVGYLNNYQDYQNSYNYSVNPNKPLQLLNGSSTPVGNKDYRYDFRNGSYLMEHALKTYNMNAVVAYYKLNNGKMNFNININLTNLYNIRNATPIYITNDYFIYPISFYFDIIYIDYSDCKTLKDSQVTGVYSNYTKID